MYLYAISLPGNMEKEINRLRGILLSEYGAVSPLSFPPIIPLFISPVPPEETPGIEKIRRIFIPSMASGTAGTDLVTEKDIFFYPLKIDRWTEIIDLYSGIMSDEISFHRLFGIGEGVLFTNKAYHLRKPCIFMGCGQEIKEELPAEDYRLDISWKRGELVCLRVKIPLEKNWWESAVFD